MMNCDLANTGLSVGVLLFLAAGLLLVGVVLFLLLFLLRKRERRSRGRVASAVVLLLVLAGALSVTGGAGGAAGPASAEAIAVSSAGTGATAAPAPEVAVPATRQCPTGGGSGGQGGSGGGSGGADSTITLVQTSTMTGLAPDVAPAAITGLVTNHGATSAYITRVTVSISGVTKTADAVAGSCDPSDYVLLSTEMLVARTLQPGQSAEFSGASIGFSNKQANQDACKNATVWLLYESS